MKDNKEKSKNKKIKIAWSYPLKVLLLTLVMSFVLNISSEALLSSVGLILSVIILLIFVTISIVFDMIGVAVTAGNIEPFLARASKKERGAKESIKLIKNAEKISSFCCDIVGDSCGILTGAMGASIAIQIYSATGDFISILVAALVSSLVASITVFGKALCKGVAVNNSDIIILKVGKILSFFHFKRKK
ncbi:MAG: hypothetical protein E7359_01070 [Clostridiales bacterium]|nr:hypothetical protein [Clostridiales bacterium]